MIELTNPNHAGNIIRRQLGNATLCLLGAKDLLLVDEKCGGLRFRIGKNPARVTHIVILLNASDTYEVRFIRYNKRTFTATRVETLEDCYVDMLHDVIETTTQLLTRF